MQGRGADHAVRESCDRARTGRGTASRRSTSESPPSDEGAVKDQAERQRGFDGNLGVLQLPSARADAHGLPRGDRFRRQPQGDVASLDQCSVVRRPVSDAVCRFVPGMHSRLHVEIMPLRPSRWPGPRRTLVSAHQRRSRWSWSTYSPTRRRKCPSPRGTTRLRHSSCIERTNRSAYALRIGTLRRETDRLDTPAL